MPLPRPKLPNKRPDPLITLILLAVILATFFPARGDFAEWFSVATKIAIALLFFLYGARLSTKEALTGLKHWPDNPGVHLRRISAYRHRAPTRNGSPLAGYIPGYLVPHSRTVHCAVVCGVYFRRPGKCRGSHCQRLSVESGGRGGHSRWSCSSCPRRVE